MDKGNSIIEKLWQMHTVIHDGEKDLLAIDRIYLHDLCGAFAFQRLDSKNRMVFAPERVFATPDHTISSKAGRTIADSEMSALIMPGFREGCKKYGIRLFDIGDRHQGIVHVMGPESGLTLPGMTVACGDSHTCTHGALGALAYGVGTNALYHALATSCLTLRRPKTMEIRLVGKVQPGVDAMDIVLYLLSRFGTSFASGYAIEYTGDIIRQMPMDERFTICNLSIETGADTCIVSPDEITYEYVQGRPFAPRGKNWERFLESSQQLRSTESSRYDRRIVVDVSSIDRQITWGINPAQTIGVKGKIPAAFPESNGGAAEVWREALSYMRLEAGQNIAGTKIDRVFIGSCANGSLHSLRKAAEILRGKKVHPNVRLDIVPGSESVRRAAEQAGLDRVFEDAGAVWGEPCCSLCVGSNGEFIEPGKRCVSTTNRNFIGRQGRGAMTHLASVRTAAMAAINGAIC